MVAGTGILAIAHALSKSGWVGLLFLILSASMSQFTGIILIKCLYTEKYVVTLVFWFLLDRLLYLLRYGRLKDYADIGLAAFGRPGQVIGWLFSQTFLFLTPTIYIILASDNISEILTQYGFVWLGRKACVWIIATIIGVPFILVRNMKDVSFFR